MTDFNDFAPGSTRMPGGTRTEGFGSTMVQKRPAAQMRTASEAAPTSSSKGFFSKLGDKIGGGTSKLAASIKLTSKDNDSASAHADISALPATFDVKGLY